MTWKRVRAHRPWRQDQDPRTAPTVPAEHGVGAGLQALRVLAGGGSFQGAGCLPSAESLLNQLCPRQPGSPAGGAHTPPFL